MSAVHVAIVGMGPRGLSILERISALATQLPDEVEMDVHLIDPGECGQGSHPSRQPSYLLTNTIANQVTMFPEGRGPSFTEWAHAAGYRRAGGGYHPTGEGSGDVIGGHDYLPRSMLGDYLTWVFDRTVRSLPPSVRTVHHRVGAVDVERVGSGRLAVRLENGFEIESDFVFLATGHCERSPSDEDRTFEAFVRENAGRNDRLVYCPNPYPVDKLGRIAPGSAVAVQGFGLTAYDVIAELTVGRGGRFEGKGWSVRYHPSGREPAIHLFSRQCLPFAARGVNQKGISGRYEARFFTREAIRRLQEKASQARGSRRLDFEREVMPLLRLEMAYAHRTTRERRPIPPEEYELGPEDARAVDAIIDPLRGRRFASLAAFRTFFVDHLVADLQQAEMGNMTSPVKAATDVIRDTRESLRAAVEFGGLTPESHRTFNERYVPVMNRITFGPPRQRNFELLALLDAGVVDLGGGPGARVTVDRRTARFALQTDFEGGTERRPVDALVIARLDLFRPEHDRSPLVGNLLARGLVRPFSNGPYQAGGIDIDRRAHPIAADGAPLADVWAVGYLVEGPTFYTYALPRPQMGSRFLDDADTSVRELFTSIQQRAGGDHVDRERQPVSVS